MTRAALPLASLLALAGGAAASIDGPNCDGADAAQDGLRPANLTTDSEAVTGAAVPALRRLDFVENLGQWNTPASFVASLGRTVLQAEEGGFVVDACPGSDDEWVRLRFELEGARAGIEPVGSDALPGLRNYLRGNEPGRWVHGARAFEQVVYAGLYEGIDLRLREQGGMPEYDLLLAPGADLSRVVSCCGRVSGLEVDEQGGLLMHSERGLLRQSPPLTWCVLPSGEREPLECAYLPAPRVQREFAVASAEEGGGEAWPAGVPTGSWGCAACGPSTERPLSARL